MTALVQHQPTSMLPAEDEAQRYWRLAQKVAPTEMVPTQYRGKPDAVLAAMIAGREVGLGPMESLRSFNVIEGKPSMSAELMLTLAMRAGHDLWVSAATRERAVVTARHRDWPPDRQVDVEFTIRDAEAAELVEIQDDGSVRARSKRGSVLPWEAYTRAMLRSRAVSEAVRQVCPEVLVGAAFTAEELGAHVAGPHGTPDDRSVGDWLSEAEVELVDDEDLNDTADEPDVVDAEIVDEDAADNTEPDEPPAARPINIDVDLPQDDRQAAVQRFHEFAQLLRGYPDGFRDWLHREGKLITAKQLAVKSDEDLVRAEARLAELHEWWVQNDDTSDDGEGGEDGQW